jgi:hypothetical protein
MTPAAPGAVCVTGMHRSGTSIAARLLQLAGVSLGDESGLLPAGRDNPAGYWENRYIQELDDEVLAALGGAWDEPPVLPAGWEHDTRLDPFRERATEILRTYFPTASDGAPIGWKDPRLSLLLPFWRTVTPIATTIVVVRAPREVAASLATRNDMDAARAAVLWMRYLLAATANDPGHLLVRHEELFADLPGVLVRVARHLDLPTPTDAALAAASHHLDEQLRHHHSTDADPPPDPLTALTDRVWADGRIDFDAIGPEVASAFEEGWIRAPADADALMAARAKAVAFEEEIRRRNRRDRAEKR